MVPFLVKFNQTATLLLEKHLGRLTAPVMWHWLLLSLFPLTLCVRLLQLLLPLPYLHSVLLFFFFKTWKRGQTDCDTGQALLCICSHFPHVRYLPRARYFDTCLFLGWCDSRLPSRSLYLCVCEQILDRVNTWLCDLLSRGWRWEREGKRDVSGSRRLWLPHVESRHTICIHTKPWQHLPSCLTFVLPMRVCVCVYLSASRGLCLHPAFLFLLNFQKY